MKRCLFLLTVFAVVFVQGYLTPSTKKSSITTHHVSTPPTPFFASSECDDINTPRSLSILLRSLQQLPSGTDIRGRFVDHARVGSIANVAHSIGAHSSGGIAPLTPLAAHCLGYAFGRMLKDRSVKEELVVALGKDPRPHGSRLCDAFARGVESVDGLRVIYTGLATTPAMFEFCRCEHPDIVHVIVCFIF